MPQVVIRIVHLTSLIDHLRVMHAQNMFSSHILHQVVISARADNKGKVVPGLN
jgi:hypothetical protein